MGSRVCSAASSVLSGLLQARLQFFYVTDGNLIRCLDSHLQQ